MTGEEESVAIRVESKQDGSQEGKQSARDKQELLAAFGAAGSGHDFLTRRRLHCGTNYGVQSTVLRLLSKCDLLSTALWVVHRSINRSTDFSGPDRASDSAEVHGIGAPFRMPCPFGFASEAVVVGDHMTYPHGTCRAHQS